MHLKNINTEYHKIWAVRVYQNTVLIGITKLFMKTDQIDQTNFCK